MSRVTKPNHLILAALTSVLLVFTGSALAKTKKASKYKQVEAPNVEDYVKYFTKPQASSVNSPAAIKADALRLKTIESIKSLVDSNQITPNRKFELLLRLGETYIERHNYLRAVEIEDYTQKHEAWERDGKKDKEPTLRHNQSKREITKAVNSFRKLVNEFPRHPRTDAALFALAQTLSRMDNDNALMYYKRLLKTHPNSALVPDTYLALGEHYFDRHKISKAIDNYKSAMQYKDHKAYPYAVYKLGWAHYNEDGKSENDQAKSLQKAVAAFKLVIKLSDKKKARKSHVDLRSEAINDLVVVWADAEDIKSAWEYFAEIDEKEKFYKMLERLGLIYAEQGKNAQAIKVFTRLLSESPLRENNPNIYAELAQLHELENQPMAVVSDLKTMQSLYLGETAWTKQNKEKIADARQKVKKNLHRYSTLFHDLGQKTKSKVALKAASELYKAYLQSFADSVKSYEIRYYLAEILYGFKEYEEASYHYLIVSKQQPKTGKYLKDSAFNAVAALNKAVKKANFPKAPPGGQSSKKLPIPALQKKLIEAIDNYVTLLPSEKFSHPMRFTAAQVHFEYGYYDEAIKRFLDITKVIPKTKQARTATKIVLAFKADREQWAEVIDLGKKFLKEKDLMNKKLDEHVRTVLRTALFKYALAMENNKKYKQAAQTFMDFQKEFPKDESADKALYNASLNYYRVGAVEDAIDAGQKIIDGYPKSKLRADAIASIAQSHEALAEFGQAAEYYKTFALGYRKDKRSPDSLFNAGLLWKGLASYEKSQAAFSKFLERYPSHSLAGDARFELASVEEKQGNYKSSRRNYHSASKMLVKSNIEKSLFAHAKAVSIGVSKLNYNISRVNLVKLSRKLSKIKINAYESRQIIAKTIFEMIEPEFQRFMAFKLTSGSKIEKEVGQKNTMLVSLANRYKEVISIGNGEFAVASLYRLGEMHERLSNDLFTAPEPQGASQDAINQYRSSLEKIAFPLKEDAYKFYKTAFQRSREVETFTKWTQLTYEKMSELQPKNHKKIREQNVEPNYFAHKVYMTESVSDLVND